VLAELSSHHLSVDTIVLGGAVLLATGIVLTGVAERFRLPSLLLFLGLGMLVADDGLAIIHFADTVIAQNLAVLALAVILFEGGLSTRWSEVRGVAAPAGLLATVGVLATAGIVAAAMMLVFGMNANTAWLVGAVVAPTDAAAVFSALRRVNLRPRLTRVLEVESGLNDPMAVLLVVGLVEAHRHSVGASDWILFAVRQLALGGVVGIVVGIAGAAVLNRLRLPSAALYAVMGVALAGLSYGAAALAGASGFLAVYLTGVVLGDQVPRYGSALRAFQEALASVADVGLFFLLGILVFPHQLLDVAGRALFVVVVLAVVARPLATVISLVWFRWKPRELAFVSWAGLRGAVPIVLATFAVTAGHPAGRFLFDAAFFVVLVSAVLQGTTVAPLARWLRLDDPEQATRGSVEASFLDRLGGEVLELELTPHAAVLGRQIRNARLPGDARIALLVRAGHAFVPSGSTVLEAGDQLVVSGEPGAVTLASLETWAHGDGRLPWRGP